MIYLASMKKLEKIMHAIDDKPNGSMTKTGNLQKDENIEVHIYI